jgi:hypothetical protein
MRLEGREVGRRKKHSKSNNQGEWIDKLRGLRCPYTASSLLRKQKK